MSLRKKTTSALIWSFSESAFSFLIQLITTAFLARLLLPRDFGLIAITSIFISFSEIFIQGGFAFSLIQKSKPDSEEYSTVFYSNIVFSIFFYLIISIFASAIGDYYDETALPNLIRVSAFLLIINAASTVPATVLKKELRMKEMAKFRLAGNIISGAIAIILAYKGAGVWSLIIRSLTQSSFFLVFTLYKSRWLPTLEYSIIKLGLLFNFSSKIFLSQIIDSIYSNIYYAVIGKYYNSTTLGYYYQAEKIKSLSISSITNAIFQVFFPSFSLLEQNALRLKKSLLEILKNISSIIFPLILGLIILAKIIIIIFLSDKWLPVVPYLRLLLISALFLPFLATMGTLIMSLGKSNINLRIEITTKLIATVFIIIGVRYGIYVMITGIIFAFFVQFWLNVYYLIKFLDIKIKEIVLCMFPYFIASLIMGVLIILINFLVSWTIFLKLSIILFASIFSYILLIFLFNSQDIYMFRFIFSILRIKLVKSSRYYL